MTVCKVCKCVPIRVIVKGYVGEVLALRCKCRTVSVELPEEEGVFDEA